MLGYYFIVNSQPRFEQILPISPNPQITAEFYRAQNNDIAFADVDNDGDEDVLVAGGTLGNSNTYLYFNNGKGNYSLAHSTTFTGVCFGSVAFADVDGDNDQDVMITGNTSNSNGVTQLYINNGSGSFTLMTGTPFTNLTYSKLAFSDVDGDTDQDVLISGFNGFQAVTELYLNGGNGNFTLATGTSFTGVFEGSTINFADVDGDNDQDVFITGSACNLCAKYSNLYLNNGLGNFTLSITTSFNGIKFGSVDFSDIDGDHDLDLLITGSAQNGTIANLYTNNGLGVFSLVSNTPFINVVYSTAKFVDIDNDNDNDLIITGSGSFPNFSKPNLYINNGSGSFSLSTNAAFLRYDSRVFSLKDVDGDQDIDIIAALNSGFTSLYLNDSQGSFTLIKNGQLEDVENGSLELADIDGDHDLDILVTGTNPFLYKIANLYTNDGSGNLSLMSSTPFDEVSLSCIAFSDVDNDNDSDVLITGVNNSNQEIAKLYLNDSTGRFSVVSNTPFIGVRHGAIEFADIDNDNDIDVAICGENNLGQRVTNIYSNNGNSVFNLLSNTNFDGISNGSISFADIDSDNDIDLLLTGSTNSGGITKLYINDSTGNFSLVNNTPFQNVSYSDAVFEDFDNDNDFDIIISGSSSNGSITKLYNNDGTGNFSLVNNTPFIGVINSSIKAFDVDNDSDLDILLSGYSNVGQAISNIYINNGSGSFTVINTSNIDGVSNGSNDIGDIDGDLDLDIIVSGINHMVNPAAKVYRNTCNNKSIDIVGACQSYTWIDGITYYANSDTTTFVISKSTGCDSLITLKLTIGSPSNDTINMHACDTLVWNSKKFSQSGHYTDTLTSSTGCDSIVTIDLTINISPRDTTSLLNCGAYTWSRNNSIYSTTGIYSDTVNVVGCDSIYYLNLIIDTINNSILNFGDSLVASGNNLLYQWLSCSNSYSIISGQINKVFRPTKSGSYAVELTSMNNCKDTSVCETIIITTIEESLLVDEIKLFPNPAKNKLHISNLNPDVFNRMKIIKPTGLLVEEYNINYKSITLDISYFSSGIYYLVYNNLVYKFIKT